MTHAPHRRRVAALTLLLLALATLVASSVRAPHAGAATTEIGVGALDWGVKESFRNYIVGGIAHGSIEVGGGTTTNADGSFRFPLAGGSYESDTGTTIAAFDGTVRFTGHDGALDMTISDVRVELAPDGARLLADVESVPYPAGGEPASYPDVAIASLDLTGVDPTIDSGTTTWTDVPATLTSAGAPAFGGFYTAGTELDPATLTYEGPGGKPVSESWTEPGTPFFEPVASVAHGGGTTCGLFLDPDPGVLHRVHASGVTAYDAETLAVLDTIDVTGLEQFGCELDPETGTVFARKSTGNVLAYRLDGGAYVAQPEVPIAGTRTLSYDTATDRLWAIGTSAPSPVFAGDPSVEVATRGGGGGWTADSYPAIDTGGRNIGDVARAADGTLVASYFALLVGGVPTPNATATLTDTGSALVATDVPGTVADTPPDPGPTLGYIYPYAAPDGEVLIAEYRPAGGASRVLELEPDAGAASGYAVAGEPFDVGAGFLDLAFDRADGSVYVTTGEDELLVLRGDERAVAARVALDGGLDDLVGGDGRVYGILGGDVVAYAQTAISPTVEHQPEDVAVTLAGSDESAMASFTVAGSGTPEPSVRWQSRAPGEAAWSDVPGATGSKLEVEATAAIAGTRYRAVLENVGGALATGAATLAVTVEPPSEEPPGGDPPGGDPPGGTPPIADPPIADPPIADPPVRTVRRPLVRSPKRVKLRRNRVARVARIRCRGDVPCRVRTSRFARVRIAGIRGRRFRARVLAPRRVGPGRTATVRVRVGRRVARRIARRRAVVRLRVVARSGRKRDRSVVRVVLR